MREKERETEAVSHSTERKERRTSGREGRESLRQESLPAEDVQTDDS